MLRWEDNTNGTQCMCNAININDQAWPKLIPSIVPLHLHPYPMLVAESAQCLHATSSNTDTKSVTRVQHMYAMLPS
jgi:hypothetical protein